MTRFRLPRLLSVLDAASESKGMFATRKSRTVDHLNRQFSSSNHCDTFRPARPIKPSAAEVVDGAEFRG